MSKWAKLRRIIGYPKRLWDGFWTLFAMGILAAVFAGDNSVIKFCAIVIYVVVLAVAIAVGWIAWVIFGPWFFVALLIAVLFWLVYLRGVAAGREY